MTWPAAIAAALGLTTSALLLIPPTPEHTPHHHNPQDGERP